MFYPSVWQKPLSDLFHRCTIITVKHFDDGHKLVWDPVMTEAGFSKVLRGQHYQRLWLSQESLRILRRTIHYSVPRFAEE